MGQQLEAVHSGHSQIGKENVKVLGEQVPEPLFAVPGRLVTSCASLAYQATHCHPSRGVILNDEYLQSFLSGLGRFVRYG